jgi:glucose/arabinose dehydrogenase
MTRLSIRCPFRFAARLFAVGVGALAIVGFILGQDAPASPVVAQSAPVLAGGGITYTVERYAVANYPVKLAFAPDGRLFYTEKTTGSVRVIGADGALQTEPVITLPTSALVERGMLGIALDPDYAENGHIWVYHTAEATARDVAANNLVRFRETDGVGSEPEVMLSIPLTDNTLIHNGGNVALDADGLLYVSVGDYENPANSQDLGVPQGKIHRFAVTDDGLAPAPDNPFPDSSIYAYGLRNAFDFDFDHATGYIYATENGDQCDDEVNLILPGFHYGAGADYTCGGTAAGVDLRNHLKPLLAFTPTQAPTGIIVYNHAAVPEWAGRLFFCVWNDGYPSLRMLTLNDDRNAVEAVESIDLGDEARCRIDLAVGPEGGLYFTSVGPDGGAIYRLLPTPSAGS